MTIAWFIFASSGMFTARYGKGIEKKLFGKDIWFPIHQFCMSMTWILTMLALVTIFIDKKTDPLQRSSIKINAHGFVGLIASILTFVQPFMAFIRPGPNSSKRKLFNISHFSFGLIIHDSVNFDDSFCLDERIDKDCFFNFIKR